MQIPQELVDDGLLLSQVQMKLPEIRDAAKTSGHVDIAVLINPDRTAAVRINPLS